MKDIIFKSCMPITLKPLIINSVFLNIHKDLLAQLYTVNGKSRPNPVVALISDPELFATRKKHSFNFYKSDSF